VVHLISIACIAVGSRLIYIVPLCYVKNGIEEPSNIIITGSLHPNFFNYYEYSSNY